ncbi:hypothetical protein SKAU_G00135300 [Synaphobranchus kaupii]|uniref:Uncharacterized protein n=1 Tax=Synaphobranchus kaupii TaxID=118154 RepID=A0A9Q1J2R9_SYNKA|nr:hypothetical protein SKAU_G00135300 [Synaphobranchus kaupii]
MRWWRLEREQVVKKVRRRDRGRQWLREKKRVEGPSSEGEVASQGVQSEGDEAEVGEEGIGFQSLFKESDSEAASMVTVESGSEEECAMESEVEGRPVKRMAEEGIELERMVKGKKIRAEVRERWDLMRNISDSEESGSSPRYQVTSPNRVPYFSEMKSPPDEPPSGDLRRGAGRKKKCKDQIAIDCTLDRTEWFSQASGARLNRDKCDLKLYGQWTETE